MEQLLIGKIVVAGIAVVIAGGVIRLLGKRRGTASGASRPDGDKRATTIPVDKVDELSMVYLQKWFDEKAARSADPKFYLIYSAPGKGFSNMDATKHLVENFRGRVPLPKDQDVVIQVLRDSKSGIVVEARAVIFESVEPELDAMFAQGLYRDGVIEIQ